MAISFLQRDLASPNSAALRKDEPLHEWERSRVDANQSTPTAILLGITGVGRKGTAIGIVLFVSEGSVGLTVINAVRREYVDCIGVVFLSARYLRISLSR
jgi:hypothetical protein